ncbi:ADOP family duplicated permease [Dyella sp. KRB-257]|uniref:ADOP family duplicated permease n=1 Tax=Dyella sp. KRB-257 TaxID=3400915 RepID=UPI003C02F110
MTILLTEIWRAWRASLRKPGFLLLAGGVLALGIGASVAVFALVQNTLWRPLPLPQADRLVVLGPLHDNGHVASISPHEYQFLGPPKGLQALGLVHFGSKVNIAGTGMPAQVPVLYFDRGLLPALRLRPVLGRNFSVQEDRPDGPKAVLIGYGLWQRAFGGDRGIVGRSLQVEGATHTIVGVLPTAFNAVLGPGDVMLPKALPTVSRDYNHDGDIVIGRLADGADVATVAAQADASERTMFRDMGMGGNWKRPRFGAEPLAAAYQQDVRPMLMLFMASAALVLLIALVNLTNLMLLRALSRNHDAAVRSALGAPLLRLMLPALGEGLLISGCGALLGMALATAGLALLQGRIPPVWLWGGRVHIGIADWGLALGVGLLGALLAAVLGLWRSRTAASLEELREGGRSGIGVRSGRFSRVLVVAQVALAAVLLFAAGVFMHALYDASRAQLGYVADNVLTFELAPVRDHYPDTAAMLDLTRRLEDRLDAIPGVTDVAVTTNLPTSDDMYGQFNNGMRTSGDDHFEAQLHGVSAGFFRLFAIPLHEGRDFTRGDMRAGEPVAIVSQDLADAYYDGHALGQVIGVERPNDPPVHARIVGVVGNTYQRGPLHPGQPVVYLPLAQMPAPQMAILRQLESLRFALRGHGNPADWRAGVHAALAEVAPEQPIARMRTMRSIVEQTTANARLNLLLIGVFATLALLLAVAGVYAVMAVVVAAREREFGVRQALGAPPGRLARLVLRSGLGQIAIGLLIGVAAALALSHALSALLMTLLNRGGGFDVATVVGVSTVLAAAGLLACLLPALRAARVAPMRALRGE